MTTNANEQTQTRHTRTRRSYGVTGAMAHRKLLRRQREELVIITNPAWVTPTHGYRVFITFHPNNWFPMPASNLIEHFEDLFCVREYWRITATRYEVVLHAKRNLRTLVRTISRESRAMNLTLHLPDGGVQHLWKVTA